MNSVAVQIGAGSIGRGFIAQLFHASGLDVRFIDADRGLVERLNAAKAYEIEIASESPMPPILIDNFHGHHVSERDAIADALRSASIVSISVGANALDAVARMLAQHLPSRLREEVPPLNVLICENPPGQAAAIRNAVREQLETDLRAAFDQRCGFVDTVVGRMVPVMEDGDSLNVRVEPYCELPVDAGGVVGELPRIEHMHAESPFSFWIDRKLYMHNAAHAAAAYLGHLQGCIFVHEAVTIPSVREHVHGVLTETGRALHKRYGHAPDELEAHAADLLQRFGNAALRDTVERVARDPVRKLSPSERFMRAAACCMENGVEPRNLGFAAAAAIRYDHRSDPAAATIQARLREAGWDAVLHEVCGLPPGNPFARLIKECGRNMADELA